MGGWGRSELRRFRGRDCHSWMRRLTFRFTLAALHGPDFRLHDGAWHLGARIALYDDSNIASWLT